MSSSAISVAGLRSRVAGVARVETVAGLLNLFPRLFVFVHVLRTRDAGRAGAHPTTPRARVMSRARERVPIS
jgi:hypothetical protein